MDFTLRKWKREDIPHIAASANNPSIAKNLRNAFPHPYLLADAVYFVNECIESEGQGQMTRAIEVDGKAVGSIGIFFFFYVYEKSGELGYWLAEDYWGRGIMPQAVRQICEEGAELWDDLVRVYAEPFARNAASCRVLEKCRFTREGLVRQGKFNQVYCDYYLYGLLKEDLTR